MTHTDIKKIMKENIIPNFGFYLAGLSFIVSLKLFYRNADADALTWILTPTYFFVNLLSGVIFLIIAFSMMLFSFMPRMNWPRRVSSRLNCPCIKKGCQWFMTSLILSIYLPVFFEKRKLFSAQLTPETLHTLIGTVVYFSGLLLLYPLTDVLSQKFALKNTTISFPMQNPVWCRPHYSHRHPQPVFQVIPYLFFGI